MIQLSDITVTSIERISTVESHKGRKFRMRRRRYYGLSFCTEGKITYTQKGVDYVSDKYHAVLLPKGADYTLYGNERGSFPLINFQCAHLPLDTFLVIPLKNPEGYIKDFERLKANSLFSNSRAKNMSIFYDILYRLSCELNPTDSILLPAIDFLENSFADPYVSNALLAEKCGISEVYFRRLFKERFNITPKQYVLELRLNKAKQLLREDKLSVSETADLCGFMSPYHFSRAFKSASGLTPTQYKNQNRNSGI